MENHRTYYALERLTRELDAALQGMSEAEQAHLLAGLRAECWQRMLQLSDDTRTRAEWGATSPLKLLGRMNRP